MNILGFTQSHRYAHDASAAIVCDGTLVAAAEEERFTREKHTGVLPLRAIEFCLQRAGLRMDQIDVLAYPAKPFTFGPDSDLSEIDLQFLERLKQEGGCTYRSIYLKRAFDWYVASGLPPFNLRMARVTAVDLAILRQRYGKLPRMKFYDHHLSHAASTFFTSGLDKATVVTIDGCGGFYSAVSWAAEGSRIRRIRGESRQNSTGFFYNECTRYLGLGEFGDGKLMGLAPYGDEHARAADISKMLDLEGSGWYRYHGPPNEQLVGFAPRQEESILDRTYVDFAAAAQAALEAAVANVVRSGIEATKVRDLCLSGGVALNCSSNGALLNSSIADSIWVFPAAGDGGLSVGAAFQCAAEHGETQRRKLSVAYLGPDFNSAEIENAARSEPRIGCRKSADIATEIAGCLAAGEVVGWFQGRMELGPRALGNRSILADPRTVEMRDRVNRIKNREYWRPLAPVVLSERASEFFDMQVASPFMLFAVQVKEEKRSLVPAIVHVDGSARPQTVSREQNARLHELITAFQQATGVPILLNTSFNDADEPIVCTPQDAIRTFLKTDLDVLVLGDYVIRRQATRGPDAASSAV